VDEFEAILNAYDQGTIGRRELLAALATLLIPGGALAGTGAAVPAATPILKARTINHVSIYVRNLARSKAFYRDLAGLPVRDEGPDFCEFRCEGSFLGLYAHADEPGKKAGVDHFCLGIEGYDPKATFAVLRDRAPEAAPTLENEDAQVYVRDPDGVRVQFDDVGYKR